MTTTADDTDTDAPSLAVCFTNVSRSYGRVKALSGVGFTVEQGEVLALLGPNGAGKTTTVKLMLGLLRPHSGRVRVFGRDPVQTRTRMYIGAMMQSSYLAGSLKVRELIEMFSSYYASPLPLRRVLELTELGGLENRKYRKLSGGQRQRVRFALAICGNPRLMFLDEPTASLDVAARRNLWACMRELLTEGRSLVLTTHYLEEADALANRIILLDKGRILEQGTPSEIKSQVDIRFVSCETSLDEDEVRGLPGVRMVERKGNRLEIHVDDEGPLVQALYRQDPGLQDLTVRQAGLEEAFLELTGRRGDQ